MTKHIVLSISILMLIACNSKKKHVNDQSGINTTVNKLPNDIDLEFKNFIIHFSKDSLFQISRVDFPLIVKELDEEEEKDVTVTKSEFHKLDFNEGNENSKSTDRYELKIKVNGNKAIIESRGIDNGIYIDTYFEKKDGKWKLVPWVDSST